jgi:hypothetical protein
MTQITPKSLAKKTKSINLKAERNQSPEKKKTKELEKSHKTFDPKKSIISIKLNKH